MEQRGLLKGSVLYKCENGVVATSLVEDHPVSETHTTKNTDSPPSTDGHFTKECAHHVRVTLQQVIQCTGCFSLCHFPSL